MYPAIFSSVPLYSRTLPDATSVFGLVYFTVLKSGRDTEFYAQRYDAESTMLPLSLLFLAVAITDPSGSKTTAPTALSLTSTPRNLCAGLKPSGIVAICIELHAGISLLRVIGSLTHRDTMPLVFTPYILSFDDMFIIDATNEAGDTESLVDLPVNRASVTAYVLRRPNIHFEARRSFALDGCGTDRAWCIDGDYQLIVRVG